MSRTIADFAIWLLWMTVGFGLCAAVLPMAQAAPPWPVVGLVILIAGLAIAAAATKHAVRKRQRMVEDKRSPRQ